jgi:hypothetical protein
MRRGVVILLLTVVLLAAAAAMLLLAEPVGPTVQSHLPRGYLAAHRYLEQREHGVELWRRPFTHLDQRPPGLLLLATPISRYPTVDELAALERWIEAGGTLVLLYGGDTQPATFHLLAQLGLTPTEVSDRPPLGWWSWREWRRRERRWTPRHEGWPSPLLVPRQSWVVLPPSGGEVLYAEPGVEQGAGLFAEPRGAGRIVLANSGSLWANGWIGRGANLPALELVVAEWRARAAPLLIDEWHHGFGESVAEARDTGRRFLALVGQLGLIYLGAVWAIGRRFGPPTVAPQLRRGSVSRDLLALAELHRASGHAPTAGARLLEAARRLGRRREGIHQLPERFTGGERELVDLARQVADLQRRDLL